jgi:hypothetical protein
MAPGGWFDHARRVVVFLLGVAVIISALRSEHDTTVELVIGSVMVGLLPLDTLLATVGRRLPPQQPPKDADTRPPDGGG